MFYIKQTKKLSDDITVQGLIVVHVSKTWRKKAGQSAWKNFPTLFVNTSLQQQQNHLGKNIEKQKFIFMFKIFNDNV
jgi:hypothetical protein